MPWLAALLKFLKRDAVKPGGQDDRMDRYFFSSCHPVLPRYFSELFGDESPNLPKAAKRPMNEKKSMALVRGYDALVGSISRILEAGRSRAGKDRMDRYFFILSSCPSPLLFREPLDGVGAALSLFQPEKNRLRRANHLTTNI